MYCNLQQQFSINLELFIVEDCHLLQEKILLREPRLFVLYHNGVSILINICQSIKLSHSDIVFPYLCISGFLVVSKYFRHLQHLNTYWRQLTLRHFRCLKYRLVWFACLRSTRLRITLDHWHGSLCLHRAPKPI